MSIKITYEFTPRQGDIRNYHILKIEGIDTIHVLPGTYLNKCPCIYPMFHDDKVHVIYAPLGCDNGWDEALLEREEILREGNYYTLEELVNAVNIMEHCIDWLKRVKALEISYKEQCKENYTKTINI